MEVVWLDVIWKDLNSNVMEKESIDSEVESVNVAGNLDYIENQYVGKEYTKINGNYVTLGIKTDKNLISVSAVGKFGYNRNLIKVEDGIWLTTAQYLWSEEFKSYKPISYPLGINQCGVIKFQGEDDKGNKYSTPEVKILPSLVTEEEYSIMESQLKAITENLSNNCQNEHNGDTSASALINLNALSTYISNLCAILKEINDKPQELLIGEKERVNIDKIKKFTSKLFIDTEIYPHKKSFDVIVPKKSLDLKEHRILKGALEELLDIFENQIKYESSISNDLRFQINEISKLYEKNRVENKIIEFAKNRIEKIEIKEKEIKTNRLEIWKTLINKIYDCLDMAIFKNISTDSWQETHIFNFNPLYQQAFDTFEQLNKLLRKSETLSVFKNDLIKSPDLYEKWVLFRVIDYFINDLKFNKGKDNVIEKMIEYYNIHSTLQGFSIEIKREEKQSIIITSEKNIQGQRPDISLVLKNGQHEIEVFLDAKYKPYSKKRATLSQDIEISALRYLKLSENSVGAFLIHPDKQLPDCFGKSKPHKSGYVSASPTNSQGIRVLAKMIIHFYMGWDNICPECGKIGDVLEDKVYKVHYKCSNDKCGAFWVQNSCRYRREHLSNNRKLYKYTDGNYHTESKSDWDVHCPVCEKSYSGEKA